MFTRGFVGTGGQGVRLPKVLALKGTKTRLIEQGNL